MCITREPRSLRGAGTGTGRCWPLLWLGCFAAVCGLVAAPMVRADGASLLRRAERAERCVAYVGIKVVRIYAPSGASVWSEREVRVSHQPPDKTRIEVLPPANIAGQVTVEAGKRRGHFFPWEKRWFTMPDEPAASQLEILLRNYGVREGAAETVAGRRVRLLQIRPRLSGNRQKNTWVDKRTGITLKSELLDGAGRRINSWEFREIEFPRALPDTLFVLPAATGKAPDRRERSRAGFQRIEKPEFTPMAPRYLPPGFVEAWRSVFRRPGGDHVMIRYTDGLNMLFFDQQRAGTWPEREGGASGFYRRGPRESESREGSPRPPSPRPRPPDDLGAGIARMSWTQDDLRLTLFGGVDRAELEKIVASMRPEGAGTR